MSLPPDDSSLKDCDLNHKPFRTSPQLEVIPAPPNMNAKKLSLVSKFFKKIGSLNRKDLVLSPLHLRECIDKFLAYYTSNKNIKAKVLIFDQLF